MTPPPPTSKLPSSIEIDENSHGSEIEAKFSDTEENADDDSGNKFGML